ncbi:MAG: hypothetical protein KA248_10535 [Kiritimatiellae bacterium]|nr:hypothetical protein [Kiritimatiellia bacterium]
MKSGTPSNMLGGRGGILSAVLALYMVGPAAAQLSVNLGIETTTTVDEYGTVLQNGDLVMVLWATNDFPYAPDVGGNPNPANAPVVDSEMLATGRTFVGAGCIDGISPPGIISVIISNTVRVDRNRSIFVRVFNDPTQEGASFYGEGIPQRVPEEGHLYFLIDKTRYPLDSSDDDGDGLNNSWEESLGSDPNNPHSDTDGVNDWEEWVAGTDLRDPDSVFILARIRQGVGQEALVGWDSVVGKRYEVYYTTDPLDGDPPPEWSLVSGPDPITAVGVLTEMSVDAGLAAGRGHFRVRVLQDE